MPGNNLASYKKDALKLWTATGSHYKIYIVIVATNDTIIIK